MVIKMSRIGKQTITIPAGVTVEKKDGLISVVGPKGTLTTKIRPEMQIEIANNQIKVINNRDDKFTRSLHGLTRAKIANLIVGVTEGYEKSLKLIGTGYRARIEGEKLILSVGFSHPVEILPKEGIKFEVEGNDILKVSGINKDLVGQVAAKLRDIRPPEPYKGKGIRYLNEQVRRKAGKAGKAGAAGTGGAGGGQ